VANNEEKFLKAAMNDEEFRYALVNKDRKYLSEALDRLKIKVDDKKTVLDAIMKVNWKELKKVEDRLKGGLRPMN
jgi:hypothetical protein